MHRPGEAQADYGEADCIAHGMLTHGSHLRLSFPSSNTGFVQLVPGQNSECLFEALIAICAEIAGVLVRLWLSRQQGAVLFSIPL